MNSIKFNEQNVSVFMNYTDLERMMNECVKNTLREIKNEQKKNPGTEMVMYHRNC